MKNYMDSDYAANKNAKGIVYRFADRTVEITLEDYLRENPGKTAADFAELKALSDEDYYETDRRNYRQTWKDVPFDGLENTTEFATSSTEDEFISNADRIAEHERRNALANEAMDKLTEKQRRRYVMYHVHGMTEREIANEEGAYHNAVHQSLQAAEKKIKKYFSEA